MMKVLVIILEQVILRTMQPLFAEVATHAMSIVTAMLAIFYIRHASGAAIFKSIVIMLNKVMYAQTVILPIIILLILSYQILTWQQKAMMTQSPQIITVLPRAMNLCLKQ